jgi:phosphoglycolate phosphatase
MAHLLLRGEPLGPTSGEIAQIAAVLFDKDGTLSHSEPMLLNLARARLAACLALADLEDAAPDRHQELHDLLSRAYGFRSGGIHPDGIHPGGITAVAARDHNLIATATVLTQVGLSWPDAHAIAEHAFERTDALHGSGSELPPQPTQGLAALLERLHAAGLRCAVISNDDQNGIRSFLDSHGLSQRFEALWSAEHHPRKPAPGAVHGLCNQLGVQPMHCALIGDADSDLRMARAAGVPVVIGYRSGWRHPPQLEQGSTVLHHWDELTASTT